MPPVLPGVKGVIAIIKTHERDKIMKNKQPFSLIGTTNMCTDILKSAIVASFLVSHNIEKLSSMEVAV